MTFLVLFVLVNKLLVSCLSFFGFFLLTSFAYVFCEGLNRLKQFLPRVIIVVGAGFMRIINKKSLS